MRQLTLDHPVYLPRIICDCGMYHVFQVCPQCGTNRNELKNTLRKAPILIGMFGGTL